MCDISVHSLTAIYALKAVFRGHKNSVQGPFKYSQIPFSCLYVRQLNLYSSAFREDENCGNVYESRMDLNKLSNHHKAVYKYCVEANGKFEWEKIYRQTGDKNKDSVREMPRVPNQNKGNGWYIYWE